MGSLEYAHARTVGALRRSGPTSSRGGASSTLRELRRRCSTRRAASPLGAWLGGHRAATRTRMRSSACCAATGATLVAEVAGVDAGGVAAAPSLVRACCADLPVVQHLARGGAPLPWMQRRRRLRELREREAAARPARRRTGGAARAAGRGVGRSRAPGGAVARRVAAPAAGGRGRVARAARRARARAAARIVAAFREPGDRDGWPLRRALEARLVAAVPPRDARARGRVRVPGAGGARPRAPARRARCAAPPSRGLRARRMIRPQPARWFEILVARDDATLALEALAATGAVELEARAGAALPRGARRPAPAARGIRRAVAALPRLLAARRGCRPSAFPEPPAATLARSLARLRAWASDAEPRDPAAAAQRGRARASCCVAPRARSARRRARRLRARSPAPARCCRRGCSCSRPSSEPAAAAAARSLRASTSTRDGVRATRWPSARADDVQALAQQAALLKGRVLRRAGLAAGATRRATDADVARAARGARPRGARRRARSSRRCTTRHDLRTRARRRQPPAVGDRERARAGVGRPASAGSPAGPATSTARALAAALERSRRARAPALPAAAAAGARRRCCSPTRGGRGRSRSSAARWACRRATRPTPACCSRSPCR